MKKIIIIGGHGDGLVIVSALEEMNRTGIEVIPYGFLNDHYHKGSTIGNIPILGDSSEVRKFLGEKDVLFITALLKVKEAYHRAEKIRSLNIPRERFLTLIHPQAAISARANVGYGTFIGPHVTVMPNTKIGDHCSLRASASVGHDCVIGDFCYIGPNSTLSGEVTLQEGVHIGPNACALGRTHLGAYSVVGMGSVVIKDVSNFAVIFGNPARQVGKINVGDSRNASEKR